MQTPGGLPSPWQPTQTTPLIDGLDQIITQLPASINMPVYNPLARTFTAYGVRQQAWQQPLGDDHQFIPEFKKLMGKERGLFALGVSSLIGTLLHNLLYVEIGATVHKFIDSDEQKAKKKKNKAEAWREEDDEQTQSTKTTKSNTESSSLRVVHYVALCASSAITTCVLHPLSVLSTWQAVQVLEADGGDHMLINMGLRECYRLLRETTTKSIYDGLLPALIGVLTGATIYDKTKDLIRTHLLPNHPLTIHIGEDPQKRKLLHLFRRIMKNTAAGCIAQFISKTIVFPMITIRYRMEAQGANYLMPIRYTSMWHCIQSIHSIEGFAGFYKGFGAHLMSFGPDLAFTTLTYVAGALLIEYLYKQPDDEYDDDEDDDEEEDEEEKQPKKQIRARELSPSSAPPPHVVIVNNTDIGDSDEEEEVSEEQVSVIDDDSVIDEDSELKQTEDEEEEEEEEEEEGEEDVTLTEDTTLTEDNASFDSSLVSDDANEDEDDSEEEEDDDEEEEEVL